MTRETPWLPPDVEVERYEFFAPPRYRFDLDRREFIKLVGGGLVVCSLWGELPAQERARRFGPGGPQELAAWLHIDETGQVTAYTGKVELGQNIRTSLSQVVAEELRLPISSVRLVMADTELTPFDAGTFGSLTTPQMAVRLQQVAASARETLLDLAAGELGVERTSLVVAEGRIAHAPSNRSRSYGELTKGQKLTKTVQADIAATRATDWKILGTAVPKVDGVAMVTGRHQYASDIRLDDMWHGKVLRPPTLEGKLESVETQAAEALGAVVVHDGQFVGVAAPTPHAAQAAIDALVARWSPARPVFAKTLFDDLRRPASGGSGRFGGFGNSEQGSVEAALAAADHQLAATYTLAYIAHVPLEPRSAVARWQDGKLTVWTGTQRPFGIRGELARALSVPEQDVRIITPDTGSGYGGKHTSDAALEAARLAKAAGRPVKLAWTREEEFAWAYGRPAGVIDVRAGVTQDGTIMAWDVHNYNSGGSALRPSYDIANVRAQFHPSDSPLRQGSYRALAATANTFARECLIDELAHKVGIDPLAFRLKNLKDSRFAAVLEAAAKRFGWGEQPPADHGFGIAGGAEKGSYVATCAEVAVHPATGALRVVRLVTAFECGGILNPDQLQNQVEGAVVMGLGGALFEAIEYADDRITNASLADYRVPRFGDLPDLETVLLDRKDLPSAGAGETPIVAVAPAIGNAVFAATGVRLRSLPLAPSGVPLAK